MVDPGAEELEGFDLDACFLAQFSAEAIDWVFAFVQEAAGEIPFALLGLDRPSREQYPAVCVGDYRGCGWSGGCVTDETAGLRPRECRRLGDGITG